MNQFHTMVVRNISRMRWEASSVMCLGSSGGFGTFNILPPPPAGVDQVPACIPVAPIHEIALFIQSPLVAFLLEIRHFIVSHKNAIELLKVKLLEIYVD